MTIEAGGIHPTWAFTEHEHRDLVRGINRIHEVACEIGRRPTPELAVHVLDVLHWMSGTLEPHVAWEEAWLYPEIDARTGTPWATRAARFDHQQIRSMATKVRADEQMLGSPSVGGREPGDHLADISGHLFGLEALLRAHIEREEHLLIPILDDDRPVSSTPSGSP
jgi:iron-sulfur cluster repair protein YtfE (RIC family)